jgi:DnaK suppressor protein
VAAGIRSGTLSPEDGDMPKAMKDAPAKGATKTATGSRTGGRKKKATLDSFLSSQLALLEAERENYLRQAESLQAEADSLTEDREPGDVQFDEESGEGDTLAVERERDLALSAQARAAIEEIDAAIARIHDGTYGTCQNCGAAIPKERLKALPQAALCVKCKSGGLGLR